MSHFPIDITAIEAKLLNVLNKCMGIASLEIGSWNDLFKIASNIHPHLKLTKIMTNSSMPASFVMMGRYNCGHKWSHYQFTRQNVVTDTYKCILERRMVDTCIWWTMRNRWDKALIFGSHVRELTIQS